MTGSRSGGAIAHGTPTGYGRCVLRAEGSCDACRAANSAHMAAWRQRNRAGQARALAKGRARGKALRRLAELHPVEFRALLDEELAAMGPSVRGGAA